MVGPVSRESCFPSRQPLAQPLAFFGRRRLYLRGRSWTVSLIAVSQIQELQIQFSSFFNFPFLCFQRASCRSISNPPHHKTPQCFLIRCHVLRIANLTDFLGLNDRSRAPGKRQRKRRRRTPLPSRCFKYSVPCTQSQSHLTRRGMFPVVLRSIFTAFF